MTQNNSGEINGDEQINAVNIELAHFFLNNFFHLEDDEYPVFFPESRLETDLCISRDDAQEMFTFLNRKFEVEIRLRDPLEYFPIHRFSYREEIAGCLPGCLALIPFIHYIIPNIYFIAMYGRTPPNLPEKDLTISDVQNAIATGVLDDALIERRRNYCLAFSGE